MLIASELATKNGSYNDSFPPSQCFSPPPTCADHHVPMTNTAQESGVVVYLSGLADWSVCARL